MLLPCAAAGAIFSPLSTRGISWNAVSVDVQKWTTAYSLNNKFAKEVGSQASVKHASERVRVPIGPITGTINERDISTAEAEGLAYRPTLD